MASSSTSSFQEDSYGSVAGWVEARTDCPHLQALCSDLRHIPALDTPCKSCDHPAENWICLSCKEVLCSRFINGHMLEHYESTGHCLAISYRCTSDCTITSSLWNWAPVEVRSGASTSLWYEWGWAAFEIVGSHLSLQLYWNCFAWNDRLKLFFQSWM